MTVCDVCSQTMDFAQGYALTTRQVTTQEGYWRYMLEHQSIDDQFLSMVVQQQAMQRTGWLVCEACSQLFQFDRRQAKDCARRKTDPPGSGPVTVQEAGLAAAKAWRTKYGSYPSWVR